MLSEGSIEEVRDSILETRMWSEKSLREALVIALRERGFIASVSRCDYKPGAGYCIHGQVVWSNKTELAAERLLRAVVQELRFTNFGWSERKVGQVNYYAECGVFRD